MVKGDEEVVANLAGEHIDLHGPPRAHLVRVIAIEVKGVLWFKGRCYKTTWHIKHHTLTQCLDVSFYKIHVAQETC